MGFAVRPWAIETDNACTSQARAAGVFVAGNALQGVQTATCVRVAGGKTETMDGPIAITKEMLGGYCLPKCRDLDEALSWAVRIPGARIPVARYGTIEVRPRCVRL